MLEIRLLGRFEVRRDGEAIPIASRAIAVAFRLPPAEPRLAHRREQLAGLLSPDSTEDNARSTLRHALWRLRKALGPDPVTGRDYFLVDELTVGLDPQAGTPSTSTRSPQPISQAATIDALIARVSAYGGDLLPGFYEDWAQAERGRLEALFENRMRQLLDRLVEAGRWDDVLAWAEHWIALGRRSGSGLPGADDHARRGQGDSARAAAVYRRCEDALREELGVEPGPATRGLYARLAKGEAIPGLPAATALPLRVPSPAPDARQLRMLHSRCLRRRTAVQGPALLRYRRTPASSSAGRS